MSFAGFVWRRIEGRMGFESLGRRDTNPLADVTRSSNSSARVRTTDYYRADGVFMIHLFICLIHTQVHFPK